MSEKSDSEAGKLDETIRKVFVVDVDVDPNLMLMLTPKMWTIVTGLKLEIVIRK